MQQPPLIDDVEDAAALQQALADALKHEGSIESAPVEAAFRSVPRHHFVPGVPLAEAYHNRPIPTKVLDGQVISSTSQPSIMAIMLEQLALERGHRVLEIGAGTGYNAALMAYVVGDEGEVVSVDIDGDIVEAARAHLDAAGFPRVRVLRADGATGLPEAAPFDRIVLTVAATDISPSWREQLAPDGRLLLPLQLGSILTQQVVLFAPADDHLASVSVRGGWFMMLRGAHAGAEARVALGPDSGLELRADGPPSLDPDALGRLLAGPGRDSPIGVRAGVSEFWGGLLLWLGLHEPSLCEIVAYPESAVADAQRWPLRHSSSSRSAVGLVEDGGLALLIGPTDAASDAVPMDRSEPSDLHVRGYGSADRVVRRLIDQVVAWDAAGRKSGEGLRICAYPADERPVRSAPDSNCGQDPWPAATVVIEKRRTRLVIDWL
jgi:protein-L-isoaspartate(D-aspartate) O-methyltransferase